MANETLFTLTLQLARELRKGGIWEGDVDAAPAPTATSIDDAGIDLSTGVLDSGTIFFRSGTHAGKSRIITTQVVDKISFETLGSAPAAGDLYTGFGATFPQEALRRAINRALQDLGDYTKYDTTLLTDDFLEEYTLPTNVTNIATVEVATLLTGDDLLYVRHYGAIELQSKKLRFVQDVPALGGYKIRLGYNRPHAELTLDTETIDTGIRANRLVYEAAAHAWHDYLAPRDSKDLDKQAENWYNRAVLSASQQPAHTLLMLPKDPVLAGIGGDESTGRGWPYGS